MALRREDIIPELKQRLGDTIISVFERTPKRVFIEVKPERILQTGSVLYTDMAARLQTATATDCPDCFEVLYHWAFDKFGYIVTIRAKIADKQNPSIDSLANLMMGAEWIEREMWELMGISFKGHPDMRHLLLMDEWPEGHYPMRRNYKLESMNIPLKTDEGTF